MTILYSFWGAEWKHMMHLKSQLHNIFQLARLDFKMRQPLSRQLPAYFGERKAVWGKIPIDCNSRAFQSR